MIRIIVRDYCEAEERFTIRIVSAVNATDWPPRMRCASLKLEGHATPFDFMRGRFGATMTSSDARRLKLARVTGCGASVHPEDLDKLRIG